MKIIVSGDFCPQNRVAKMCINGQELNLFADISNFIRGGSDYAITNFECPIIESQTSEPIIKCGPNLSCDKRGLQLCRTIGFNCITLANNHIMDYGDEGLNNTINAANSLGLDYVGVGSNISEAERVLYKTISNETLAIINCCEHEFSIADSEKPGANPLNPIRQFNSIKDAKKKADYVIVIVHGGHEHWQLPSPRMVETYRFFIDAGADAVINHHQHCYSGFEIYHNCPIFYGLGNLCFDSEPVIKDDKWNYGYIVCLSLKRETREFELFPYYQCGEHPSIDLLPKDSITANLAYLNSIIKNDELLKEETNKYYNSEIGHIRNMLEPTNNRIIKGALRRGWIPSLISAKWLTILKDYVMCESHRDKLDYFFKH